MNRATVYYHFADREQLLEAVSDWSSKQLTRGFGDSGGTAPFEQNVGCHPRNAHR